ncbi:MAG: hypothetical protein U9O54_06845 [Chloroflexota bacterium]|nr:hypothetical protein [Chloroflexota bacterium]
MLNLREFLAFLGMFGQVFGLIVFGVAAGWFTLYAFQQPERRWELQSVVFGVFFLFVALLARFSSPGAFGGFLLGVTGAFLYWGIFKKSASESEDEE